MSTLATKEILLGAQLFNAWMEDKNVRTRHIKKLQYENWCSDKTVSQVKLAHKVAEILHNLRTSGQP